MEEREIVKKLKSLKKIKPEKEFAFSLKKEILGENFFYHQEKIRFFYFLTFSFVLIFSFFFLSNFETKKFSKTEKNFEILSQSLEEIKNVSSDQQKAKEKILNFKKISQSITPEDVEKISKDKLSDFVEKQMKARKVLASIDSKYLQEIQNPASCLLVEKLIKEIEQNTLTEKQKLYFEGAKEMLKEGNCVDALTNIWYLNYIR
jgi:hypothetical protein